MSEDLNHTLFSFFDPWEFKGQTAIVTGGSRGIGRAVALGLSLLGANLIIGFHKDDPAAQAVKEEIHQQGGECLLVKGDVALADTWKAIALEAEKHWGRIDILINNAALVRDRLFLFLQEEDWDQVMAVNLKGIYLGCKAVLRAMIARHFGRIINLTSPSALLGRAGQTNYSAAKGGLVSFSKSLAREVAHLGITVNCVSPGVIETELFENLPEKTQHELIHQIPAGVPGRPEVVVGPILYLASKRADYLTGQVIAVDGGLT
jgi:3-oxoacyl-[acyl-carrier protein] reductase